MIVATYVTIAEFLTFARTAGDETDSDIFQLALDAAEEAIDLACGTSTVQFDPCPASVKLATMIQGSRWAKRRDSPFGIAGSPEMGNEMRLLARIDPDVAVLLGGHGEMSRAGGTS